MEPCVFFVDPMSYNNLSIYDWNLIQNLKAKVYFFGSNKYDYKELNVNSNLIYNYNSIKFKLLKAFVYIINNIKLLFYVIKLKPQIIHFQWMKFPTFDIIFVKIIRFISKRTKIVLTAHNFLPHNSGEKYLKQYKKIYSLVDKIIVHSKNTKEQISEIINTSEKINVIVHGILKIENDEKLITKAQKEIIEKYNLKNKTIFLNIGQIHSYKGTDVLIDAWNSASKLNQNDDLVYPGMYSTVLIKE